MKPSDIAKEAQRRFPVEEYISNPRKELFTEHCQLAFVQGVKWALGQDKKTIDLSKVAEQPIPMLFSHYGTNWMTGFLTHISDTNCYERRAVNKSTYFRLCKFDLEAHPVAWFGGDCPLPKGVLVKVYYRKVLLFGYGKPKIFHWHHYGDDTDIIAFKVTGLQEGYVYPWET